MSVFILLSASSQALSLSLSQSVFAYYKDSAGSFDGMVVNCNRAWQNYVLADEVASLSTLCPQSPSRSYYSVTSPVLSVNGSGLLTYPIYKTQSMILLQKASTNETDPFNIMGAGNDANTGNLLKEALVSGSLPTGNAGYQAVVTDFIAGTFGLGVGDQLKIVGFYRDAGGNLNTTIFSKTVTISGILSENKLNAEFNIAGVPIFTSGEFGPQTAYSAGVRPISCIGSASPFYTYSDLHQGPFYVSCKLSPKSFAFLGDNFLRDFYGSSAIGPSEVLFRFFPPPSSPSELLDRFNRIYSQLAPGSGYQALMLWKSNVALLGPGLLLSSQTFDNASAIAKSNMSADDLELGIGISPVLDRLQTIATQTLLLVTSASILGIILELAVFFVISPRLILEIEIYKANGLGALAILKRMLVTHSLVPIGMITLVTFAVLVIGVLANSSMVFPALLGLGFALLLVIEFSALVSKSMSHKEVRQLNRGRVG